MSASAASLFGMQSSIEHQFWPPVITGANAALAALLHQMEHTQWLPHDAIMRGQYAQLAQLAEYAHRFSPHTRERLKTAGITPAALASPEGLTRLPPLTQSQLHTAGTSLFCTELPPAHMPVADIAIAASTPFTLRKSALSITFNKAAILRDHAWHGRDFSERLMVIRPGSPSTTQPTWEAPVSPLYASAPARIIATQMPVEEQLAEINAFQPACLLTTPANLKALLEHGEETGAAVHGIKHIWSIADMTPPELRARAEHFFHARVEDHYARPEFGIIAVQCPVSRQLHIVSETLLVECIGNDGKPCAPDETGALLVTDLHNFATPLIRYAIGVRARITNECPCGRQLPTITG